MFYGGSPQLNVHGETRDTVVALVLDFINDYSKLEVEYVGIVHGRSSNILKNKVHEILRKDKRVDSFKVDLFNPGLTIVKLRKGKFL